MALVLIVDDSPTETMAFKQMLERNGFRVITAANGDQGIAMAKEHKPDVVLMDVVMPGLNGFQATRSLTRDTDTAHIPVVIVTTKDQETDKVWGRRQGACGYLVKPVTEELLVAEVQRALS